MKIDKTPSTEHENFKVGQGYGSGEPGADSQSHKSAHQYGDNPIPPSGGDWGESDEAQPPEDLDAVGEKLSSHEKLKPKNETP